MRVLRGVVIIALFSAAATAACTTAKPHQTPEVIPPSIATASEDLTTKSAVLAAYTGMWSDFERDALTANWQNPASINHATGDALQDLKNTLAVNGHHGWVGKGTPILHPEVRKLPTESSPATAEVVDCADLSHFLTYVAATGALKDSTPSGRHLVDASLALRDGVWKVSRLATGDVGSC